MGKPKSNKGFTLLELLLYIAILAIVLVILVPVFTSIDRGIGQITASSEVDSNIRFVVDRVGQDVDYTGSITTPSSAGSASSTLVVVSPSGSSVAYCLIGGIVYRQASGSCTSASEKITSAAVNVTNLNFTNLQNTNSVSGQTAFSVQMDITVNYNSSSTDWQYSESNETTFQVN